MLHNMIYELCHFFRTFIKTTLNPFIQKVHMNKKGFYNQGKIENRCRGNRYKSVLLNNMQYIMGIKIGAVRLGSGTMTKMTNGESVKLSVLERICKDTA